MINIEEDILKAVENLYSIELVAYNREVNLPGTVYPGTILKRHEFGENIIWDQYDNQLAVGALYYNQDEIPLKELTEQFEEDFIRKGLDFTRAKPLPHVFAPFIFYRPIQYKKHPCRLICSWNFMHNAWHISMDTIIPSKTWREEQSNMILLYKKILKAKRYYNNNLGNFIDRERASQYESMKQIYSTVKGLNVKYDELNDLGVEHVNYKIEVINGNKTYLLSGEWLFFGIARVICSDLNEGLNKNIFHIKEEVFLETTGLLFPKELI